MTIFRTISTRVGGKLLAGDILINTSTFKPAHCGIVVDHLGSIIHATNKGIFETNMDEWSSQADVFRAAPALSSEEAKKVVTIAQEIMKGSTEYGLNRAVFKSTFSSGSMGNDATVRLKKYKERLDSHQQVLKNVYCSELVILCYQIAWMKGANVDETHRCFIALDGCHTWPSTLRRLLNNNPTKWSNLGTLNV